LREGRSGRWRATYRSRLAACAAFACLAFTSVSALADDHACTEGPVMNVSSVPTVGGPDDPDLFLVLTDKNWQARLLLVDQS